MSGRSDDLSRRIARIMGEVSPTEKQMLLVKLDALLNEAPKLRADTTFLPGDAPARRWFGAAIALLKRSDSTRYIQADTRLQLMSSLGVARVLEDIKGNVVDAIEQLKLELELDGRSEVGTAYAPGDTYRYFADLKRIVASAQRELFVVDPYFDEVAFDDYLSAVDHKVAIKLLVKKRAEEIARYAAKHIQQYNTTIETRRSGEAHDRLLFIDANDCWITGGSINAGGKKSPAYLIPVHPELAATKLQIYGDVWSRAAAGLGT